MTAVSEAKPISILLVEDNQTDQFLTKQALKKSGILNRLNIVEDGVEALAFLRNDGKYLESERPDLVLLDLNMPRKDGREVLAEMKSDPSLKHIPVVVLTTSQAEVDVARAYEQHANSFITKPFDFSEFQRALGALSDYWLDVVTLPPRELRKSCPETAQQVTGKVKVLLIEDNPADALIARAAMAKAQLDFQIEHVQSMKQAEEVLATSHFDVVLTDLSLPDAQGLEALERVRLMGGDLPVIVLTGLNDEEVGVRALREGAEDYLVKGELKGHSLGRAVRYAMDKCLIRRQLVEAQRNCFVERLSAGVAHDFNNLLATITGSSELLKDIVSDSAGLELLSHIETAARKGAILTGQLLAFGHAQNATRSKLDASDAVTRAMNSVQEVLRGQLDFTLNPPKESLYLEGDRVEIEQILVNVALFAAREVKSNGSKLTLTVAPQNEGDRRLVEFRFLVEAASLTPRSPSKFWEPYACLAEPQGFSGGVGLPAVRALTQQMNGTAQLRKSTERVLEFSLFYPRLDPPEKTAQPVAPSEKETSGPTQVPTHAETRLLLVEDDPLIRKMNETILKKSGFQVFPAPDAARALSLWESEDGNFSLLITDICLGDGHDGLELAEELQRRAPELPILFVSGYSEKFRCSGTVLEEGRNFLQKPFSLKTFLSLVRERLAETENQQA